MDQPERHPIVSFLSAFFWVFVYLLSWVKALIAFVTISIPRLIYSILSYSLTLTLNFWSFAIMFVLAAVALNYWIRFRYLNTYTQLKEVPLTKPDAQELHPDVNTTDAPPVFHNYLDEFLQAVRVFGFLEKPVFHELARHLQTRRLIAGDSLALDQDKSFYCVVDGTVQVFAPSGKPSEYRGGAWDNEDMNGYELMNEVTSGGTLSSLFTILNLFTEDIKIGLPDDEPATGDFIAKPTPLLNRQSRADSDVSHFDLENLSARGRTRSPSVSSSGSTAHPRESTSPSPPEMRSPSVSSNAHTTPFPPTPLHRPTARKASTAQTQVHHGTVARATVDTTLAVIPAEAFRRLTKKFPKASAHIVQVIMTRFSRVTFNAAHGYLGLTSEVLRTEKAINDIACHPLPASFYEGGGMQHLRQRFDGAGVSHASDSGDDYFSISAGTSSSSTVTSAKPPSINRVLSSASLYDSPVDAIRPTAPRAARSTRHMVQAGDLLSSTAHNDLYKPRNYGTMNTPRVPTHVLSGVASSHSSKLVDLGEDDFDLRQEVMNCIAVSIGLQSSPLSGVASAEASPALSPTTYASSGRSPGEGGLHRSGNGMLNSFGSLSLLEMGDDRSSATGASSSTANGYMTGLDNEVEILFFPAGSYLATAGEKDTGLFYVIEGFLDIVLPDENAPKMEDRGRTATDGLFETELTSPTEELHESSSNYRRPEAKDPPRNTGTTLFTVKPGGIAGYLASLSNTASYVDIIAKTDTYVGCLPHDALERLLEKQPIVLLTLAKRLISLLSPLVLQIDASLDWMQVNAGQVLWREGDSSDSFYIVINGRLRAITEQENGGVHILAEYGQGDTVGEIDVITRSPRRSTVHAIRDTELIRMPQTLFNAISMRNPQTTAQILRMIASRVRSSVDSFPSPNPNKTAAELRRNNTNLKTVAVLPVSRSVPIDAFARKLHAALEGIGAPSSYLNQASVSNKLGKHAFTRMGKLKTAAWLADQEQRYKIVLYVADSAVNSTWTQTCIRQADFVMMVGMGDDPSIGEYERLLLSLKTTARKELVLLHPDRSVMPGSTREWLKNRPWVHQHIHVELPGLKLPVSKVSTSNNDPAAVAALKNLKDIVQSEIQKYRGGPTDSRPQRQPHTNDFSRLARRICGKSIGLVLGGGGARGISHLGLLRAMEEYGIPIDHIGGTSIGAFIGGLYAREADIISASGRAKQFSARMGIGRILSDITYPIVAYTTGHEFNRSVYKAFYDLHIEDMWLPFFCNTANITTSNMDIHETGYAWRYIRASMTLVGLLPPLVDRGNMLVDGGYMDNLPVRAMFDMGTSAVFASDVGSINDNSPRSFGDSVSGWWLLINRWNPFSDARAVPAITEIQSRLAYVSSVRTLEEAKTTKGCLYMAMPVQEYGTLQFGKFEEIQERGYHEALKLLDKWDDEGKLPSVYIEGKGFVATRKRKGKSVRRNSI